MSWGTGTWGTTPWGGFADLAIEGAVALTERSVLIEFTSPVLAESSIQDGDATNPRSWLITNQSTGDSLTILGVEQITSTKFTLWTLEKLDSYLYQYGVDGSSVLDATRVPISGTTTFGLLGLAAQRSPDPSSPLVDLKNSMFGGAGNEIAGGLVVGSDGDYLVEGGDQLLKKLILRRLTVLPGEFIHLPQYGVGIKLKETVTPPQLIKLRAEIERQLLREPEIMAASVRVSIDRSGVLLVSVKARTRANEQLATTLTVPTQVVL